MEFAVLKAVHVACVAISYLLFFARGIWMINGSPLLQQRWLRVLPHVNDTLLLAAAIALAVMINQYPLKDAWLTAKVVGLVVYIAIGTVAIKPGRTRGVRIAAWIAAQIVFFYIVGVALTHNPLLFF